jgi:flagellar biosynthetic protein FlhB
MGLAPLFASGLDAWGSLFRIDSGFNLDTLGLVKVRYAFWLLILATLIIGVPMIIVILLTQAAVGGLNFAVQAMNFKGNRIDPIAGLKRMFSMKGLVELAKSVLKRWSSISSFHSLCFCRQARLVRVLRAPLRPFPILSVAC